MKYFTTLLLASGLLAGPALANEDIEHPGNWIIAAEIGAITTSGNTSGTSVTGKFEALQDTPLWSNEYTGHGYLKEDRNRIDGEDVNTRSAQRYQLGAKAGYKLMEENSTLYMLASLAEDKFGAYTRSSSVGVGHGFRWFQTSDKTLDMEFGPGYFDGKRASGEREQGMIVRGRAAFRWKLNDNAAFAQILTVERGSWNMHSTSETSLSTRINGSMQMKAAFRAQNDTSVPVDKQNTDTQTSLTLVYSF